VPRSRNRNGGIGLGGGNHDRKQGGRENTGVTDGLVSEEEYDSVSERKDLEAEVM
jgi:hypothetical protein